MAKTRDQKSAMLEELSKEILKKDSIVFANYSGLSVSDTQELRKKLREQDASLRIVKKTLLQKALKESSIEGASNLRLDGEVAIAVGHKDETAPARVLQTFRKEHEQLKILSGVFENRVIPKERVELLASIPSRTELIAKVLGSIQAPISNFVGIGSSLLRQFVRALSEIQSTKKL